MPNQPRKPAFEESEGADWQDTKLLLGGKPVATFDWSKGYVIDVDQLNAALDSYIESEGLVKMSLEVVGGLDASSLMYNEPCKWAWIKGDVVVNGTTVAFDERLRIPITHMNAMDYEIKAGLKQIETKWRNILAGKQ